jgi:hypothetical protein
MISETRTLGVQIVCASEPIDLANYINGIGDAGPVPDMMVGDLQRVIEYPALGFAVEQEVPGKSMPPLSA